jgi:hypothetical protein
MFIARKDAEGVLRVYRLVGSEHLAPFGPLGIRYTPHVGDGAVDPRSPSQLCGPGYMAVAKSRDMAIHLIRTLETDPL